MVLTVDELACREHLEAGEGRWRGWGFRVGFGEPLQCVAEVVHLCFHAVFFGGPYVDFAW